MKTHQIGKWTCIQDIDYKTDFTEVDKLFAHWCLIYDDASKRLPAVAPFTPHLKAVLTQGVSGLYTTPDTEQWAFDTQRFALNLAYFDGSIEKAVARLEEQMAFYNKPKRVHVLGLGDVGATLAIGLKLLGESAIETLGLFDLNPASVKRWAMELGQINASPGMNVVGIEQSALFDCDVFVFCASKYVPAVGAQVGDVRMVQYEENAKIVNLYAQMARSQAFKGLFIVVSDPVDLLCLSAYHASQYNSAGRRDDHGLLPEQIRGYGLGVMHGRARYYSDALGYDYKQKGRVFGPHGKELIVVENIEKEDRARSEELTEKVVTANLEMRGIGYKPYVAPALSSGAISIVQTLTGQAHFSATYVDGIYWGTRNKWQANGTHYEPIELTPQTLDRVLGSYHQLEATWEKLNL